MRHPVPLDAPPELPRELVLASAGSGKTYHLSTRIIELLAAGAPPGEVLASTFTRKAAGEILDRVLLRLAEAALDPVKAGELGGALAEPGRCRSLLARLVHELHHINVGTLDAFFIRLARSFSHELELPSAWTISDGPIEDRLRTEAVQAVLAGTDVGEVSDLLHRVNRGAADRRVHDQLVDMLDELLRIRRQLAPGVTDAWSPDLGVAASVPSSEIREQASELARWLKTLEVPVTKKGTPVKAWEAARDDGASAIEALDWTAVFGQGIGAKILSGEEAYARHPISAEFAEAFTEARDLARVHLAGQLRRAGRALGGFAELFAEALGALQHREAAYRFEDVTTFLAGPRGIASRPDLHYRLDQQVRHILLDEFQDTSFEQWRALEPLVDELLSGHRDERAGVIVADPKQSIYGWRGARPELVHQVGTRYALGRTTLDRSWRSSSVVLDLVTEVFRNLPATAPIRKLAGGRAVAEAWMRDFTVLEPARELPGYATVHVGPGDARGGNIRPNLLRYAAERVRDLHHRIPDRSVGVLVRTNDVLAHLMNELGALGVRASGEGGAPLTDTAPVNALLSLCRLADHPSDTVALYHVARTPVGALVDLTVPDDRARARRVSAHVRARLVRDGYGPTLADWVRGLTPECDEREALRLLQLVELGHRWDTRSTLRPGDFVRYVAKERVEDPSSARVQVMTIHSAKGLEFDVVVLPELYAPLAGRRKGVAVPERDPETGWITRVYPSLPKDLIPLFPGLQRAAEQLSAAELRDGLSLLYVGLTRARHATHLVIPPEGRTPTRVGDVVRSALDLSDADADDEGLLWAHGDAHWHQAPQTSERVVAPTAPVAWTEDEALANRVKGTPSPARRTGEPLLRPVSRGIGRNLAHRSPSSHGAVERVDLADVLRLDSADAALRGTVVHAWCEEIRWIEDGLPHEDRLRALARRTAPGMSPSEVGVLAGRFRSWMRGDAALAALSRNAYPEDPQVTVRVEAELPFVRRVADEIQEGVIDRLVTVERAGLVVEAEVIDFKTDRLSAAVGPALDERVERYRPQITSYREWVCEAHGLTPEAVRGTLLFLEAGVAVRAG